MINRTYLPTPAWVNPAEQKGSQAKATTAAKTASVQVTVVSLWQFILVVLVICSVTCAYLWQLGTMAAIKVHTDDLNAEVLRLERENADLMLEVAMATTPAKVEAQALAVGMKPAVRPVYVAVRDAADVPEPLSGMAQTRPMPGYVRAALDRWQDLLNQLAESMPAGIRSKSLVQSEARP